MANAGDPAVAVLYDELRRQAARQLRRERPGHTLSPTALVHEVYLRFAAQRTREWQNRSQFLAVSAMLMRRILVEHARRRGAAKRAGDLQRISLDQVEEAVAPRDLDLIALDTALIELSKLDPRQAHLVELRFFGGLDLDEVAELPGVSSATVSREWRVARA
jgi:RNA polymerase sigma factor (TIGR02999 family)